MSGTCSGRPGGSWSAARVLAGAALAIALMAGAGAPAAAQAEALVSQRSSAYNAARAVWQARLDQLEAQTADWRAAVDAVLRLRASGDDDELDAAQRRSWDRSQERSRLAALLDEARDSLDVARIAFQEALDERREGLEARLLLATTREEEQRVARLITGLDDEYRRLAVEATPQAVTLVRFWPYLELDPRDSPAELRGKLDAVERKLAQIETEIAVVDEDIARIEARMRTRRRASDAMAALDRFDATSLPVGPPGRRDEQPQLTADTVGVQMEDLPLEQQIEILQGHRAQLEDAHAHGVLVRDLLRQRTTTRGTW